MGYRVFFKSLLGMLLLASGITCVVLTLTMYFTRIDGINVSELTLLICSIATLVCAIIYIICGTITLLGRTRRNLNGTRPYVMIGIVVYIIALIVSSTNGIRVVHLVISLIAGIIIPAVFFITLESTLPRR